MAGRKPEEGLKDLTHLGSKETKYLYEYSPEVLESIDNLHTDRDYFVKLNCPEFTSLCPLTGQPDFATHIYILYSRQKAGGKQIIETLLIQFQKPRRLSRRLREYYYE